VYPDPSSYDTELHDVHKGCDMILVRVPGTSYNIGDKLIATYKHHL
jgi:hypothetical protein